MEQPFHGVAAPSSAWTPRRLAIIGFVVLLHVGLIYALAIGLAQGLAVQIIEDLAVVDVQPDVEDKKPPPPPPEMEKPPPPIVPPPEFSIAPEAVITPTITAATAPPAAPKIVGAKPKSKGRNCDDLYPAIEQRLQQTGNTLLAFTITSTGAVSNISVAQSSGYPRLDEAAVQCAQRWSYTPATKDGVPADVQSKAIVKWTIK